MKVHISQVSKELLEEIGGYTFEFRGYQDVKVSKNMFEDSKFLSV